MKRPDCWEVLGIHPTRDLILIRDAFRKQVKRHHPDSSAQYTSPDRYNFFDVKAAVDEALQRAQSGNLLNVHEVFSENPSNQTFSKPQLNPLFSCFSVFPFGKLLKTLSLFPAMLVSSLVLEQIQNAFDLLNTFELIISIILGLIDGIFFGIFGGLLFFWLPGLAFILLLWAGIRTKTGYITFIICWLVCLATYFIGFYQPVVNFETNEEVRRHIGNFLALVILPSFLLGGWIFLLRKQMRLQRS